MTEQPRATLIQCKSISKAFAAHQVLDNVNLDVPIGNVVTLIGPSGSGKTTLLRCLNLLEPVSAGTVVFDGEPINPLPRGVKRNTVCAQIGFVFQRFNLWPHMTALENVMQGPLRVKKKSPGAVQAQAVKLLARVGLDDKVNHYPHHLSGGQQQRVAIARALAMEPRVILFDEPTSALDPENVGEVLSVIRELATEGRTMVIATHEMDFARSVSDTVIVMDNGTIIEKGAPEQVFGAPQHERTARFLSRMRATNS